MFNSSFRAALAFESAHALTPHQQSNVITSRLPKDATILYSVRQSGPDGAKSGDLVPTSWSEPCSREGCRVGAQQVHLTFPRDSSAGRLAFSSHKIAASWTLTVHPRIPVPIMHSRSWTFTIAALAPIVLAQNSLYSQCASLVYL
jgi:hypothetical protein